MSKNRFGQQDIVGIATVGFFLLLVGVIFAITPDLLNKVSDFLLDFELQNVAPNWKLPAPAHVLRHVVVYNAVFQFCLVFGLFQLVVLGARFILRDSIDKVAGTISNMVFWFGTSWIVSLLIAETFSRWFVFVGWIIMLIGLSLVVKGLIVLMVGLFRKI